ncbi:MAG: hypothetical protein IJ394_01360 [Bacteroidales bacterium]|nr:hypothetical protein [Bacteroidales bacterium]
MKRFITSLACMAIMTAAAEAQSQDYIGYLSDDLSRIAGNYHHYEFEETELTPAPKGFRPVYISHYSRHGSRYHTSGAYFRPCMPQMAVCDSLGLLSEDGKAWYEGATAVLEEHHDMFGMLTFLGAEEQTGIGERISRRFPEVFSGRNGRTLIRNRSTRVQRSIVSMAAFNTSVAQAAPKMEFSYSAGDRYRAYLNADARNYELIESFCSKVEDSLKSMIDTRRVFGILFNDPEAAEAVIDDPYSFVKSIFLVSSISPNTDARPDLLGYFPFEDLLAHWVIRNNHFYAGNANSIETADETATVARPLIEDIVSKADEALTAGSNIAADFRFGHDTGLLPLISTIGIKGMETKHSAYDAHRYWNSSEMMSMASNLQMIFYADNAGDIIVKLLYNEKETHIPALEAEHGPYYKWKVLRDYLVSL